MKKFQLKSGNEARIGWNWRAGGLKFERLALDLAESSDKRVK